MPDKVVVNSIPLVKAALEKGKWESGCGVEAVFITKDKEVYISSGLKDSFTLTDRNFTMRGAF